MRKLTSLLQVFTFDLVDFLHPTFRMWVWRALVTALGAMVNVVVPVLLGVALAGDHAQLTSSGAGAGLQGVGMQAAAAELLLLLMSGRRLAAGAAGLGLFQGGLWLLAQVFPLRVPVRL